MTARVRAMAVIAHKNRRSLEKEIATTENTRKISFADGERDCMNPFLFENSSEKSISSKKFTKVMSPFLFGPFFIVDLRISFGG